MTIRVVLQAMDQGHLLVDNDAKYVRTGRGVMIYVAFLTNKNDAFTDETLQRAVDVLLDTKIFTHFSPEKMITRPQSLRECPEMDILIVPQASLGGKVKKGHSVQFHDLVAKDIGTHLYERFCYLMRAARGVDEGDVDANGVCLASAEETLANEERWIKYNGRVVCGTFGNRQGLRFESEGPFTHSFDI